MALDEHSARLLEAFVWPDQTQRIERLRRAVEVARPAGIEVVEGDYVERLPELLADRRPDVLTVVMSSVTTAYLSRDRFAELRAVLDAAGAEGPLAWLSFDAPRDDRSYEGVALDLTAWPDRETRRLAQVDFHAIWLEWH